MITYGKLECYWCEQDFYTELGRMYHLHTKHPTFFKEYDEVNTFFDQHTIPDQPDND